MIFVSKISTMFKLNRKQHLLLIFISVITLYSCNYIVAKKDENSNKENLIKENININKEQAKILVNTSKTIVETINLCSDVENDEIEEVKKSKIIKIKENQKQILKEIKTVSESVMVSIPSDLDDIYKKNEEDKTIIQNKIDLLNKKIIKQRELITALKKNSLDESILKFSDTLLPIIDENIYLAKQIVN